MTYIARRINCNIGTQRHIQSMTSYNEFDYHAIIYVCNSNAYADFQQLKGIVECLQFFQLIFFQQETGEETVKCRDRVAKTKALEMEEETVKRRGFVL